MHPVHVDTTNVRPGVRPKERGRDLGDRIPSKGVCLGEIFKPAELAPWPAEACRTVRGLKARIANLEADNNLLQERCADMERRVAGEMSAGVHDLYAQARSAVEEAKVLKCEFLRTVSHELRTPLGSMQAMLQALCDANLDKDLKAYALQGLSCCKKLDRLMRDLLEFKALASGSLLLEPGLVLLDDVLCGVEHAYGPACRHKGLELVVKSDPSLPRRLWGDERRLRQILEHLLDNALRFTPVGEIRVEAHALSEGGSGRVRLCLSVRDTGVGIPEKALERIQEPFFEPFSRVESGLRRMQYGPGLGLAVVGKLAGLMGGHVRVESMEGLYTAVHCTVRLETPPGE